jgi:AraC-like DNA-binding protein
LAWRSSETDPAVKSMLLQSYPALRSRNLDVIKTAFSVNALGNPVRLPAGRPRDEFIANAARFQDGALVFIRYDSPITIEVDPCGDFLIGYQIREVSEVAVDGEVIANGALQAGCLIPKERAWSVQNPSGYEVLILRVATATLRRKLSALLGSEGVRLDLLQPSSAGITGTLLRESVFRFAKQLDVADRRFLPLLVANATEDICLGILTCLSEQFLDAARLPAAPSDVQLGRVEQYLVANYARPLTVETLAEVSGVSGRCVFQHFLSRYGRTPQEYLGRIRLGMAHAKLSVSFEQDAVASVALQCGFPNLSHFEQAYRDRFGEPPAPMAAQRRPRRR